MHLCQYWHTEHATTETLAHRIAALAHLKPDWDGYHAPAIDMDVAAALLDYLYTVMPAGCPDPAIGGLPTGGCGAIWYRDGFKINVHSYCDCDCGDDYCPRHIVIDDLRGDKYSSDDADTSQLKVALAELTRRHLNIEGL